MQPTLLKYGDFKAIVYRVKRSHLPVFQLLVNELLESWQAIAACVTEIEATLDAETLQTVMLTQWVEVNWGTMQAIAAIIPTAPIMPLRLKQTDTDLLTWLFLAPGKLLELQALKEKEERVEVDEETGRPIAQLPFPTCGDNETDTIFNLINAFGGNVEQAKLAYEWLDQQALNDGIEILNELNRDPDERTREYLVQSFERSLEADDGLADRLDASMGLTPFARFQEQMQPPKVETPEPIAPVVYNAAQTWDEAFTEIAQRRTRKRPSILQESNSDGE